MTRLEVVSRGLISGAVVLGLLLLSVIGSELHSIREVAAIQAVVQMQQLEVLRAQLKIMNEAGSVPPDIEVDAPNYDPLVHAPQEARLR